MDCPRDLMATLTNQKLKRATIPRQTRAPPTISLCHSPQNTTAGRVWLCTLLYGNVAVQAVCDSYTSFTPRPGSSRIPPVARIRRYTWTKTVNGQQFKLTMLGENTFQPDRALAWPRRRPKFLKDVKTSKMPLTAPLGTPQPQVMFQVPAQPQVVYQQRGRWARGRQ